MTNLINKFLLGILIVLTTVLIVNADEKRELFKKDIKNKKSEFKNKDNFKKRFDNMSSERKDFILDEFDSDGDGNINEEEREELKKRMEEYRKNN